MMQLTKTTAKKQLDQCIALDTLSPREARIAIAKDVLAALELGTLNPKFNYRYVHSFVANRVARSLPIDRKSYRHQDRIAELRTLLPKTSPPTVCGVGALFVAHVARVNRFKVSILDGPSRMCHEPYLLTVGRTEIERHLRKVFSLRQLFLVEAAFEASSDDNGYRKTSRAAKFGLRYKTAKERLAAICNNIIEHGEFKP